MPDALSRLFVSLITMATWLVGEGGFAARADGGNPERKGAWHD